MDYQLLDSGDFTKLEKVGNFTISRPAPAAVWRKHADAQSWRNLDAVLTRKSGGDGEWRLNNSKLKEPWTISILDLKLEMRLTGFGHLGIFPEQHENWIKLESIVRRMERPKVLNLFAYTGVSSLICARAGAEVVHVDASKTSVSWARRNAELSNLQESPIRWIVEDVQDFVAREQRRGNKYNGIILDPPSYGRGQKNQLWKIEKDLLPLLDSLATVLADEDIFVCLSSHSPGYTPLALENLLRDMLKGRVENGTLSSSEMVLYDVRSRALPSGTSAIFSSN